MSIILLLLIYSYKDFLMGIKPISVQLYSLREQLSEDFTGTMKAVADAGFVGVEPAGFYGHTPAEFRKIVEDLGMVISSSHSPWCTPDSVNEVIDVAGVLGMKYVACGYGPDYFKTVDAIKETADTVNGMVEKISAAGLTLMQHNHFWEFEMLDGRLKYDIYAELCPDVQFELDVYWAANFGECDSAEQVKKFAKRTPFMHAKDGSLLRDAALLAAGDGKIDLKACVAAADDDVLQWVVVELDRCDTDMIEAVTRSCRYLSENGLGKARK